MMRSALATAVRGACLAALLLLWPACRALAQQPDAAETVREHFKAITAEDYTGADKFFSAAFLRAFKADVEKLNYYYLARQAQLGYGYKIMETEPLSDPGRETMLVVVEFGPYNPDAFVTATERMHYYLIREKAEAGTPLRDADGMAWRIDIFDALRYTSLADARRRPYLYTRDTWDDPASRELRSRQGLYRIYLALETFREANGQYPFRLLGGENRRDELIAGGFIKERYPDCGFAGRAMEEYGADRNHAGDFGYYAVDKDGDGKREGFWLLLHGKDQSRFYYTDRDIIYIINQDYAPDQRELAEQFAEFWHGLKGQPLALREITWEEGLEARPQGVASAAADALHRLEQAPAGGEPLRPLFPGIIAPREGVDVPGAGATGTEAPEVPPAAPAAEPGAEAAPVDAAAGQASVLADAVAAQLMRLADVFRPQGEPAQAEPVPAPAEELEIHSYGM
jgi:hypothetical protein